jgi:2-amino-4-hydroxy-6-hydroxymethyldihydropteridine diphosphokinase
VPLTAIALGSNLGDRRAHLEWAVDRLRELLTNLRVSSLIETEPVDVPEPQPPFLNGAVVGETTLGPEALLSELLALERECGRERTGVRAPRTLDLDLMRDPRTGKNRARLLEELGSPARTEKSG